MLSVSVPPCLAFTMWWTERPVVAPQWRQRFPRLEDEPPGEFADVPTPTGSASGSGSTKRDPRLPLLGLDRHHTRERRRTRPLFAAVTLQDECAGP